MCHDIDAPRIDNCNADVGQERWSWCKTQDDKRIAYACLDVFVENVTPTSSRKRFGPLESCLETFTILLSPDVEPGCVLVESVGTVVLEIS